ncbi:hypothetical protein MHYP_G00309710 [Metynnis hypsauchen]
MNLSSYFLIQHFNFMEVYEVVVLGVPGGMRPQIHQTSNSIKIDPVPGSSTTLRSLCTEWRLYQPGLLYSPDSHFSFPYFPPISLNLCTVFCTSTR